VRETDELELRFRAKDDLRKRLRAIRRAVPAAARHERSLRVETRLAEQPEWTSAKRVALYASMHSEVETAGIQTRAFAEGKEVFLPRMDAEKNDIELARVLEGDELVESGYGFMEPGSAAQLADPASIDLVLVPVLAVDERGFRLGYGRGFYDRLLPRLPRAFRVALAFDFQLMGELPNTPGDEPVHCIVADAQMIRPSFPSPSSTPPSPLPGAV
jgi:5-formyltetrahydrofolate cyclo-ligase